MSYDYRSLVEALDEIVYDEESEDETASEPGSTEHSEDSHESPQELLKSIVHSVSCVVDCLSSDEIDDYDDLIRKLKEVKNLLDSVHETEYDSPHQEEILDEEEFPIKRTNSDAYGAGGMGPKVSKDGMQDYSNKNGSSYAARHGFVGI